jgi:tetratricopeptide (TPR) repeat protein
LKAAESTKNPDLVMKWASQTSQVAKKVVASQQPKDEEEVEEWKRRVDYAKQVDTYTEYSLYAHALQTADPKKRLELFDALEQRNPNSEYLQKAASQRFLSYQQAGDMAKTVAFAEKVLATDQSNEDMLLFVADNYLQTKKDPEKVYAYTAKMVDVMASKPKPEGVADADWAKRKDQITGLARFMSGKQAYIQNKFGPADKELRAALPLLENQQAKAEALFYLGVANYKMEKIQDAVDFSKQCAAIKSPFQAPAQRNLTAIRSQYRGIK